MIESLYRGILFGCKVIGCLVALGAAALVLTSLASVIALIAGRGEDDESGE